MNTGSVVPHSQSGLLSTVGWRRDGATTYALEGSVFIAGAALQWLRDELQVIQYAAESEAMALAVPDTGGVYFVPAFVGLGAPYWDAYARGSIFGITRGTNRNHLVRAALESMAYQTRSVVECMTRDSGIRPEARRVPARVSARHLPRISRWRSIRATKRTDQWNFRPLAVVNWVLCFPPPTKRCSPTPDG